jgi:signal transduction histidine kinase
LAGVRVRDNGIGIAPEHQAHVFDRFYQADGARSQADGAQSNADGEGSSGTGLGLAIAHWIARAHNGEIRVESALGQGSTFEVILPIHNHGE